MQHFEAAIKIALIAIKRSTGESRVKRGTLSRKALDVLRRAVGPRGRHSEGHIGGLAESRWRAWSRLASGPARWRSIEATI
jgi:hypothetical protein